MRRPATLAALWLAVAVVAVGVAWAGVSVVGDQVTDERPAPLAAAEIETKLDAATSTTGATTTTTSVPTTTALAPTTITVTPTTSVPVAPTASTTAPPPAPPAETRTYPLQGGTAALRFSPEGVTVVFANPAPGFTVDVEPEHGNGVKVEFESDTHESRVDGWWDGGPVDRVQEEDE